MERTTILDGPRGRHCIRVPRYRLRKPIAVQLQSAGHWHRGRLENLSLCGAYVTARADIWAGEEIKLLLDLSEPGREVTLRALTVWKRTLAGRGLEGGLSGYGLVFPRVPDEGSPIGRLIDELKENGKLLW